MTARFWISAAIAAVGIAYIAYEFGRLVLDDKAIAREAGEDAAYDADTAAWLGGPAKPSSEFDEWCEQAYACTRESDNLVAGSDADLELWENELQERSS